MEVTLQQMIAEADALQNSLADAFDGIHLPQMRSLIMTMCETYREIGAAEVILGNNDVNLEKQ